MGKIIKKAIKKVQKIIPNEIKPVLPFIVPFIPGLQAGLGSFLTNSLNVSSRLAPYLAQGILSAGTQAATQKDVKPSDLFRTAALSMAPAAISEGLGSLQQSGYLPEFMTKAGDKGTSMLQNIQSSLGGVKEVPYGSVDTGDVAQYVGKITAPETLTSTLGLAGTQALASQAPIMERLNEQAIRDYEAKLVQQGVIDKSDRRNSIFGYFSRAGYGDDEINSMLSKYGYASGGRVGYKEAGLVTLKVEDLLEMMSNKGKDKEDKFDSKGLSSGIEGVMSGYKLGTGKSLLSEPEVPRFTPGQFYNQGGAVTPPGMEMDLRGGGFIRIGSKEKADDVNARVSKNEFVMTADAVRGAGRGDPRVGAKRMYEIMNKFEAMA